jgi:preprotein translocase subunit SecA
MNHLRSWGLFEAIIYSAFDEPLLTYFGGDGISDTVKQLGMKEDVPLQHKLITSSIKNAQEKIAGKVTVEQTANSPSDWFLYNLGKRSL